MSVYILIWMFNSWPMVEERAYHSQLECEQAAVELQLEFRKKFKANYPGFMQCRQVVVPTR